MQLAENFAYPDFNTCVTSITKRLRALTWDALIITSSHSGFKWKIIDLMLTLQGTGMNRKKKTCKKQKNIESITRENLSGRSLSPENHKSIVY